MRDEARRRLGLQEAELIGALTVRSHSPEGMDLDRVEVTRRQLALKRVRVVARAWPSLRRALGQDFESIGLEVLARIPMAERHHAVVDGLAIAQHCCEHALGGDDIQLALLDHNANWTQRAGNFRIRTGPWLGVTRLPESRGLALGARLGRTWIWIFRADNHTPTFRRP